MGPSLFSDGNRALTLPREVRCCRFNGAVAIQRRKWDQVGGLSRLACGFNGAVAIQRRKFVRSMRSLKRVLSLQWGRRYSATEIPAPRDAIYQRLAASMGPSLFSDGNRALDRRYSATEISCSQHHRQKAE